MIHPNFARPFRRKGEGNGATSLHHLAMSSSRESGTAIGRGRRKPMTRCCVQHRSFPRWASNANDYTDCEPVDPIQRFDIGIASFQSDCSGLPAPRACKKARLAGTRFSEKRTRTDRILTDLLRPIRSGAFDDSPATNY